MTIKWKKVDHQVSGYQLAYTAAKRQGAKIRYADITEIKDRNKASESFRIYSPSASQVSVFFPVVLDQTG